MKFLCEKFMLFFEAFMDAHEKNELLEASHQQYPFFSHLIFQPKKTPRRNITQAEFTRILKIIKN